MAASKKSDEILLVSNIYPPSIGGPATFMHHLACALVDLGRQVDVICSSEGERHDTQNDNLFELNHSRQKLLKIFRYSIEQRYRYELFIRARLLKEFLLHRTILVNGLEDYVAQISRITLTPYVLKIVGDSVWERARNLSRTTLDFDDFQNAARSDTKMQKARSAQLAAIACASNVVTPSEYLRKVVIGWGVPDEKVAVIPNAFSHLVTKNAKPPEFDSLSSGFKLLFVGRLTNWKGVETCIIALTKLSANVTLTICGDGPQLNSCLALANQLGVRDRCSFLRSQTHAEVIAHISSHHALILSSLYEGLSHTLLDALASGLPVIASSCGGNSELITDGENGLLIRAFDPEALCDSVNMLQKSGGQLWHALAANAHRRAQDFSSTAMTKRYVELLDSKLEQKP